MSSKTVGFCVISPTEKDAERLINRYKDYFDEIYLELTPNIKNFANARNKTLKKVKTDYWMWADTDDDIKNPENIREVIRQMEEQDLDAAYLPYEYMKNKNGDVVAFQWRERIMRTSHPFKWEGALHETAVSKQRPQAAKFNDVVISHNRTEDDKYRSIKRNYKIWKAEYDRVEKACKDHDPRTLYYLGKTLYDKKEYGDSILILRKYIASSGWDEEKYFAHTKIADCLVELDELDAAKEWALQAIEIRPDYPDAYLSMAKICFSNDEFEKCLEWVATAKKKPKPDTLSVVDPTLYTYRPLVVAAMAHFSLGRVEKAYQLLQTVKQANPNLEELQGVIKPIEESYLELQVIKQSTLLGKVIEKKGDLKKYFNSLPGFVRKELRLREIREKVYPPKTCDDDTVVIFCGETYNVWGPDTLGDGMGGSEEAITYLAPELAKLGYKVTVYNEREEELEQDGVTSLPWQHFNPADKFNNFIGWRQPDTPAMLTIKANYIVMYMQDYNIGN